MSDTPKISVVIPTCHRNDLLAKCLDCLAPGAQTLPADQYEVIVTDDGSRSTAAQMVQEQYPWAHWVPGPRKGPAANRNNGAKFAQGEWLAFTDDDCLPSAAWLQAYNAAASSRHLVYEGKTICSQEITSPMYDAPINLHGGNFWACNIMICKKVFDELGGFDASFLFAAGEDIDLRERLRAAGFEFCFAEAVVVDHPPHRRPPGRIASRNWEAHMLHWHKFENKIPRVQSLLTMIFVGHMRRIFKYRVCVDSVHAFFTMLMEMMHVAQHYSMWNAKYAALYARDRTTLEVQNTR